MFEVPVHFYSLSPARVRRTSLADGVSAVSHDRLATIRPGTGRRAGGQSRGRRFGAAGGLACARLAPTRAGRACRGARLAPGRRGAQGPGRRSPAARCWPGCWPSTAPGSSGVVVVAHPSARAAIAAAARRARTCAPRWSTQAEPTGMLDAVSLGCAAAARWSPDRVWITWCDQVAVHPETVARLASARRRVGGGAAARHAGLALHSLRARQPTAASSPSDSGARGTCMPARGVSDMGLFSLSAHAAADGPAGLCRRLPRPMPAPASATSCRSSHTRRREAPS